MDASANQVEEGEVGNNSKRRAMIHFTVKQVSGIMMQILIPPLWSEMYANHRRVSEADEWVVSL